MDTTDYSIPIRKSLQGRQLLLGIPSTAVLVLFIIGVLTIYLAQIQIFWGVLALLFIAAKLLTKKDPYLIDIVFYALMYDDVYLP
jgi:type IV secretory pathway VirB3-like protein